MPDGVFETWNDEQGNRKRKARVIASRVQFVAGYKRLGDGADPAATMVLPDAPEPTIEVEIPF